MAMTGTTRWLAGASALLCVACIAYGLHATWRNGSIHRPVAVTASAQTPKQKLTLAPQPADNTTPVRFVSGLEQLPPSLRGTDPDGNLRTDNHGNLIIEHDIRLLFDYFLAGLGEESLATLQARLHAYIQQRLPEPAATQARQLLADYLALLEALNAFDKPDTTSGFDTSAIADHLQHISELRRDYLSPDAVAAFFGDEEAYDRYTLETLNLTQRQDLDAEEKHQQMTDLEAQLPEQFYSALQQSRQALHLRQATAALRDDGGSDTELQALRTEQVGAAAAERLAGLDQRRAQWQGKMDEWLTVRTAMLGNPQLSPPKKTQLMTQWRSERFDAGELQRVQALERIHDSTPDAR